MTAVLGLGTHRLTNVAAAAHRAAITFGASWVDTAPNYLQGHAHRLLAPVLAQRPVLRVSTKVGFLTPDAASTAMTEAVLSPEAAARGHSLHAQYVRWQIDRNRAELGRPRLDTVFLHNPECTSDPSSLPASLRAAFAVLEEEVVAEHITGYGVASWSGFTDGLLVITDLERLASEAAGTPDHHLSAIQLPVSLVQADHFTQALHGRGPIREAAELGWQVFASAPLHGGELVDAATRELAELLCPGMSIAQACLSAVASCPGVSRVLLSASTPKRWDAAVAALREPSIPSSTLEKVLHVLASHH